MAPVSREASRAGEIYNLELKPSELVKLRPNFMTQDPLNKSSNQLITNWHLEGQLLIPAILFFSLKYPENSGSMSNYLGEINSQLT